MSPVEIKILLIRAGVTQTQIAKNLGVTVGFVNQIISGLRPTRRVREAIAEAVGKPVEKLWPSYTKVSAGKPEQNNNRKAA